MEEGSKNKALIEAIKTAAKARGRRSPVWIEMDGYRKEIELAIKEGLSFVKIAELLNTIAEITVSAQTVRNYASAEGLWKKRKKRTGKRAQEQQEKALPPDNTPGE